MKIPKIPIKISAREKKALLIGGVIAFIIISYQLFTWYNDFKISIREYSVAKRDNLERQLSKISDKGVLQRRFDTTNSKMKELENGLLIGDTPPVAQAELQRVLKDIAVSLNIEIKSERTLTPVDMELYIAVPVEIGFIATTAKLKSVLYEIKTSPFLLNISEMNINVRNINSPVDAYTTMVVRGFIKKPQITLPPKTNEKNKKEV